MGWALVGGPIATRTHHEQLALLSREGYRFAGITSYLTFPHLEEPDARDYGALCEAWCHCFREPERFLPPGVPRALISGSDFTDHVHVRRAAGTARSPLAAPHDLLYVGAFDTWKREAKRWDLAMRCIRRLSSELGLRALVIGPPAPDLEGSALVRFCAWLPWGEFLATLERARCLLVTSVTDPSPRVLAEALCLDVPVAVNRAILGGWQYVNAFTGEFFDDEADVVAAVTRCLSRPRRPSAWFRAHHGPHAAGARLLRLLHSIDSSIPERSHLTLVEPESGGPEVRPR